MCQKKNKIPIMRLKGKDRIDFLFHEGTVVRSRNLIMRLHKNTKEKFFFVGVSVAKRNFCLAVDRNRIKRQLRSAFIHIKEGPFLGSCMIIYTGKPLPKTSLLSEEILSLFVKSH